MLDTSAFIARAAVAKSLGGVIGLAAFFLIPAFAPDTGLYYRIGVLLWAVALGGVVAVMGLFDRLPLWPSVRTPWWARGAVTGLWMAAMLVLLNHAAAAQIVAGAGMGLVSPWWLLVDGAILGALLDLVATRAAGEGDALVKGA